MGGVTSYNFTHSLPLGENTRPHDINGQINQFYEDKTFFSSKEQKWADMRNITCLFIKEQCQNSLTSYSFCFRIFSCGISVIQVSSC